MEEKSTIGKKILIILLCLLLLVVIGVGILMWQLGIFSGDKDENGGSGSKSSFKKSEETSDFTREDSEEVELTNEDDDSDVVVSGQCGI